MIEMDFAMSISLCHAYGLLVQHGLHSFYTYLRDVVNGMAPSLQ